MSTHMHVQMPNGGIMSLGYPLHPAMAKQLENGTLKPVDGPAPVSPRPADDREGEAPRVGASPAPGAAEVGADINLDPDGKTPPNRNPFEIEPPAPDADHSAWAEFAVSQGMTPEEAANLTVEQIRSRMDLS